MTQQIDAQAKAYAHDGTQITSLTAASGPRSIEGEVDVAVSAIGTLETLIENEHMFDGFVIACGCDPGLYACREVSEKPVVGIGEGSMIMACLLGARFTAMTALDRMVPRMEHIVKKYGLWERCASVRAAGVSVLDIAHERDTFVEAFLREAKNAINEDGADVICLSGAAMAGMDKKMQGELGIPVVDGVASAVKLVEAQVAYGVGPSKRTFPVPDKKLATNISDQLRNLYQ